MRYSELHGPKMQSFVPFLTSSSPFVRRLLPAAACLALSVVGCGVSDYESRMENTIEELKLQNQFVVLGRQAKPLVDPSKGTAVNVTMRVPLVLDRVPLLVDGSGKPELADQPMPPERLKPPLPLVEIPGYQVTLEQYMATTNAGTRPIYLYVGVEQLPGTAQEQRAAAEASRSQLLATLKENLKDQVYAQTSLNQGWKNVPILTPVEGATKPFKELSVSCTQPFEARGGAASAIPGTFLVLAHEILGHQIYLAWRLPAAYGDHTGFLAAAHAAAGTLAVAPAGAKPRAPAAP